MRHAIQRHADGPAPGEIDVHAIELWVKPQHQGFVVTLDDSRIIAEVVHAGTKQQALVGTQAMVLQHEVRVAYREIHRVNAGDLIVCQRFRRDYETVDREHDAAKLRLNEVIGIACDDHMVGGHRTAIRNDGRLGSMIYA